MKLSDPGIVVNLDKNAEVSIKVLLENHPLIENIKLPSETISIYLNNKFVKYEEYKTPIKNLVDFSKLNENEKASVNLKVVYLIDKEVQSNALINGNLSMLFNNSVNQRKELINLGKKLVENQDKLLEKFKTMIKPTTKYDLLYEKIKNGSLLKEVPKENHFCEIFKNLDDLGKKDDIDYCPISHIWSTQLINLFGKIMLNFDLKVKNSTDSNQADIDTRYMYNQIKISIILNKMIDAVSRDILLFIYKYGPLFYSCKEAISSFNTAFHSIVEDVTTKLLDEISFILSLIAPSADESFKRIKELVKTDIYFERMSRSVYEKVRDYPIDKIELIEVNISKSTFDKICSIEKMNGDYEYFCRMTTEPGHQQSTENIMTNLSKYYSHIFERNIRIYEYYGIVYEDLLNLSSFYN